MKTEKTSTNQKKTLRMRALCLAAVITILNLLGGLGICLPQQVSAQRGIQDKNPPPGPKTRLLGRTYSGGDVGQAYPWEATIIVHTRQKLYFRWSTTEQGVTSAHYQVTNLQTGFPTGETPPANIIASGQVPSIPAVGQTREFEINFIPILPATPPGTPKQYYVRLVPQKGDQKLTPSAVVKVTYSKPDEQPVFENAEVNLNTFANNLKMRLDGKTTGYSYAIYEYETLKKSGAGGYAVLGSVPQSPDRRMTTMSMSKTITAAAVMKALEQMNEGSRRFGRTFSINSKIALFLPSDWQLGPHVSEMTLKDLLTHTSGLREVGNDPASYEGLRQVIANGSTNENFRKYKYVNMNFCLFRIIVPYMLNGRAAIENLSSIEARTTGLFLSFVKQKVLGPVGLSGASLAPSGPQEEVRYYNFHNPQHYMVDESYERASQRSGASSWFMSVKEFGKFIAALRAGKIVSAASFKQMTDNNLGMFRENSIHGRYWNHNGILNWGNGSGSRADWMIFPNGITAVVLINSTGGLADATQEVVKKAFNTAW
jgi:CubicO group peptidase (beta-lactamase class C family)